MEEIEAKTLPPDLIDAFLVTSTSFPSNSPSSDIVNGILEILFENSLKIEYNCEFLIPENRVVEFLYNILASPPVFTFTSTSEIVTKALDVFAKESGLRLPKGQEGATDGDLPALFAGIDAHVDRLIERSGMMMPDHPYDPKFVEETRIQMIAGRGF